MKCLYCDQSFKLSKYNKSKNVCLDCEGVCEDLDVEDSELTVDIFRLKNPSGKTQAHYIDTDLNDFEDELNRHYR